MRFKELVNEVESPFQRGFDAVDRALTPSKWGTGTGSKGSKQQSRSSNSQLRIDRFEIKDTQEIMSAVVKGNVSDLSRQQIELARVSTSRLNNL